MSKPTPLSATAPDRATHQGPIGLYVHIPFCETKCPYCDFNTYTGIEPLIPSYVDALCTEIGTWGRVLDHRPVSTVFFGGGTPSYLPEDRIGLLLGAIEEAFEVGPEAEVTLEANPDDFSPSKLAAYLDLGVNRLSIGVQSLDDRLLGILGRRHSAAGAVDAFRMAAEAGFENVSIDLMYGLPHQSLSDWNRTLEEASGLKPKHLSMYCLTLEGGTPMEQWVDTGRLPAPDSDLAADMYLVAQEVMASGDYRHYEISNWAQPGYESRHNLTYWRNGPYLGVGPGAHSYLADLRFSNLRSPREYVRRLKEQPPSLPSGLAIAEAIGSIPVVDATEAIDRRLEMAETMMLGLRLDTGIAVDEFSARFGVAPQAVYTGELAELTSDGLVETVDSHVRLTDRGRILGNEVFSRFFA